MSVCVFKEPEELEALGFLPVMPDTLESLPAYRACRANLDRWAARLPGLHTPRNSNGTGGSPPLAHQLRHTAVAAQRRHNCLTWGMGVGKTIPGILLILHHYGDHLFASYSQAMWDELAGLGQAAGNAYLRDNATPNLPPGSIHIVSTRIIREQVWMKELSRHGLDAFAEVIETEAQLKASRAPIFIYHYDFLKESSARGVAQKKAGRGFRLNEKGRKYTLAHNIAQVMAKLRPPSFMIVDEVHRLRPNTERTRCMTIVRKRAKRVLTLTGTLLDGWVEHAATVLEFTYGPNSAAFPYSRSQFTQRFTQRQVVNVDMITGGETVGRDRLVPGISPLQIPLFLKVMSKLTHRLNLGDPEVLANVVFPRVENIVEFLELDPTHRFFYTRMHSQNTLAAAAELEKTQSRVNLKKNMLVLMNDLRLATASPWARGFTGESTAMIERVAEILRKHRAEGRKILIGTTFVEESRWIHEALQAAGFSGVRLYAVDNSARKKIMDPEMREELIEQFMDDPSCGYLISNKELVAEGLNLAETASVSVSTSFGFRANVEAQWRGRIERPGQTWTHVDRYTLCYRNTVDMYVYQLLMAKLGATAAMIDLDFTQGGGRFAASLDAIELGRTLAQAGALAG
jgi:hypothetical protein